MNSNLEKYYRNLRANYDNSNWWRTVLAEVGVRPVHALLSSDDGVRVMTEDWDTLVVLDACRFDLFESVADLGRYDDYTAVTSAGSMTAEWVRKNFAGGSYPDTVYVTANPFVSKLAGDVFHELVEVWRDSFDLDHRTVLPGPVVEAARAAHERFPDKRLVVHFMQPHFPFVRREELQFSGWRNEEIMDDEPRSGRPTDPWDALEMGLVTREAVLEGYADNLSYVLEHVDGLLDELDGRTVVTSDHGNLLGERAWPFPVRLYGHPQGVRLPGLVRVPWAVVDDGDRREVVAGATRSESDYDREQLTERLRDLGYHE